MAVAGASGSVKLLEYAYRPEGAREQIEEDEQLDAAEEGGMLVGGLLRSADDVELHCSNVRELHFAGAKLFSAADDEVAQWELPLTPA